MNKPIVRIIHRTVAALVVLACACMPGRAADTTTADNGTVTGSCGSCTYTLTATGVLTIGPGEWVGWGSDADAAAPWLTQPEMITEVYITDGVKAGTAEGMFRGCTNLTLLDIRGLDISGASSVADMFAGCPFPMALWLPAGFHTADGTVPTFAQPADGCRIKAVGQGSALMPAGASYASLDAWHKAVATAVTAQAFVLTRKLDLGTYALDKESGMGTLYYPVPCELEQDDNVMAQAYTVTGVGADNVVTIKEIKGTEIPAYTPVLLHKEDGGDFVLPPSDTEVSMAPVAVTQTDNLMVGCNNAFTIGPSLTDGEDASASSPSQYVMQKISGRVAFRRVAKPYRTKQFRAYLQLAAQPNGAKALALPDNVADGLLLPTAADVPAGQRGIYDLQGRRVTTMLPGHLYVVNGRKVWVEPAH